MTAPPHQDPALPVRRVDLRYFAIALVPVAIFWINAVITAQLFPADPGVPATILQDGRPWLEAGGRYRFLATTWFFAAFTVLALALLVRTLARPTAPATRAAAIGTVLFFAVLALTPTIRNATDPDGRRVYDRLGADLFEAALSRGTLPGCAAPDDRWLLGRCGEMPVVTLFDRVIDIINLLAGLGVGALIVGMILCLQRRDGADPETEAVVLAENLRQMRQQLYLSSLILTFGMLFATSWMHWPMQLVADSDRAAFGSLVLGSSLYMGTYFSLLILSFYLPVALVLDDRVRSLAERACRGGDGVPDSDPAKWRDARGLKESTPDHLRAGFALTAPILAAFAGGIAPLSL